MRPTRLIVILWIVAAVLAACAPGGAGSTQPASGSTQALPPTSADQSGGSITQAAGTLEPTGGSSGGRDIGSLDVCALLKQEDVASALQTQIARPADRTDMGKSTHGCTYYFGSPNSSTNDSYIVYVEEPSLTDSQIQLLMPEEKTHPVSGVGDIAYLITEMDGTQFRLEFLLKGNAGVEVIGSKADWVQKIGEMLLARLK
jgi:hypothetical protein